MTLNTPGGLLLPVSLGVQRHWALALSLPLSRRGPAAVAVVSRLPHRDVALSLPTSISHAGTPY